MAHSLGMDPKKTTVGLLIASDGIMEANFGTYGGEIRKFADDAEVAEGLFDRVAELDAPSSNLAKNIAQVALDHGSTDNMAIVWIPNLLALPRDSSPIAACVCDTPGEGPEAQKLIDRFEHACMSAAPRLDRKAERGLVTR